MFRIVGIQSTFFGHRQSSARYRALPSCAASPSATTNRSDIVFQYHYGRILIQIRPTTWLFGYININAPSKPRILQLISCIPITVEANIDFIVIETMGKTTKKYEKKAVTCRQKKLCMCLRLLQDQSDQELLSKFIFVGIDHFGICDTISY